MAVTSKLQRYRYLSTLGSGGMAVVSLAEDTVLGRRVALKRMTAEGDPRGLLRLRREALVGASISHPNLVSIYDVLESDDGGQVIVMEYVPGETLRDALGREGKLPAEAALRILEGVAAGLDAIHRQGIVHRDVKPPNILLGTNGTVKVADLGIASVLNRTRITSAGAVVGSFRYMAPEQLEDKPPAPAIDVYALTAVAFEMLSGRPARCEQNPVALAHAISTQPPPDLHEAWPEAPRAAVELLRSGMARDPAMRPRSASELTRRLRAALVPEPTAPIAVRAPAVARAAAVRPRVTPPPSFSPPAAAGSAPPPQRASAAQRRSPAPLAFSAAAAGRAGAGGRSAVRDRPPPVAEHRRSRGPLLAGLLAIVAVLSALAVILSNTSSPPRGHPATTASDRTTAAPSRSQAAAKAPALGLGVGTPQAASETSQTASHTSTSAAAATSSSQAAAPVAAAPVGAVKSFYGFAASHQYPAAWALADPTFRSQLQSYDLFKSQQSAVQSITFDSASVLSQSNSDATVAVRTTSVRGDGAHHCAGTVDLRPGGSAGSWLLHLIHINCTPA